MADVSYPGLDELGPGGRLDLDEVVHTDIRDTGEAGGDGGVPVVDVGDAVVREGTRGELVPDGDVDPLPGSEDRQPLSTVPPVDQADPPDRAPRHVLAGGQIVGGWGKLDMLGLMQQVGLIPSTGPRPDAGMEDPTPGDTADDQPPDVLVQHKTVVRRFLDEIVNAGGNPPGAAEVLTPDFVWHGAGVGLVRGQEAFLGLLGSFAGTFPDLRVTVEDLIAQGDKVVARYH